MALNVSIRCTAQRVASQLLANRQAVVVIKELLEKETSVSCAGMNLRHQLSPVTQPLSPVAANNQTRFRRYVNHSGYIRLSLGPVQLIKTTRMEIQGSR